MCPPFAEEMNRSRRTVRLLCGEGAGQGLAVLNPDLHGTGDSGGEFGEARWGQWLEDLGTAAAWLRAEGCSRITLLGIRAGALLAWDVLRSAQWPVAGLVLWQPVLSGKAVVTDLLRMRIAAGAAQGGGETVSGLRQRLEAGHQVEAAGYTLSPEMSRALDGVAIGADVPQGMPPACWIEIVGDAEGPVRAPALALADRLRGKGVVVDLLRQQDPPFWSTAETTVGRGTVAATLAWLRAIP